MTYNMIITMTYNIIIRLVALCTIVFTISNCERGPAVGEFAHNIVVRDIVLSGEERGVEILRDDEKIGQFIFSGNSYSATIYAEGYESCIVAIAEGEINPIEVIRVIRKGDGEFDIHTHLYDGSPDQVLRSDSLPPTTLPLR